MAEQTMRRAARLAASQVRAQPRVSESNVTAAWRSFRLRFGPPLAERDATIAAVERRAGAALHGQAAPV
jgi:hypothetical protein